MRREPYVLKPWDVEVSPEPGGLHVEFSSEKPQLRVDSCVIEDAISCAFDGRTVRVGESDQGRHSLHIAGLDMEQEWRVRAVLSVAHIFHQDGDEADGDECPDLCLALDWQKQPEDPNTRTTMGEIEYRAKWERDTFSASKIEGMLYRLVQMHSALNSANQVIAPPSSYELAGRLAERLGERLGILVLETRKKTHALGQSTTEEREFHALCERQMGMIEVLAPSISGSVLIVDDLYGSGGTIRALTSRLRALGAERILALTVTKRLKHHRQT